MFKIRAIGVLAAGAALLLAASIRTDANGQLDAVLRNMQDRAAGIKTIRAKMDQVKRLAQLGGRETYSGEVLFKRVGKGRDLARINYDNGQQVSVIGDEITLYQPAIKQAIVTSRQTQAGRREELSFISTPYTSVQDLKRQYDIRLLREEQHAGETTSVLELTPKRKGTIEKLTLWVSHSRWIPVQYRVLESNRDETTFTLSGIMLNQSISDGSFRIRMERDTKIIRQ